MAKYFGIYANESDRNAAVTSSALTRPYVALVDGQVDYDSYWDGRYYLIINGDETTKYWFGQKVDEMCGAYPYISLSTEESGESGSGVYYGVAIDTDSYFSIYKSNGKSVKHLNLGGDFGYNCTDGEEPCEGEHADISDATLDEIALYNFFPDNPPVYSENIVFEFYRGSCDDTGSAYASWSISADCAYLPCHDQTRCENAGGTWTDDGAGGYYCDCDGSDECECVTNGGEWVDDGEGNYTCQYPEEEDPGE